MKALVFQIVLILGAVFCLNAQSVEAFPFSQNRINTDVTIDKIIIGDGKTEVKIQITATGSDIEVFLYPPQSEQSIILRTFEKNYNLIATDSLPFFPEKATILSGETKTFSLIYNEIPKYITEFDIIERVEPFESGFSFFNVKLSKTRDKKISLRFDNLSDFKAYFKKNKNAHLLEGFWEIEKELLTSFKNKKTQPTEVKSSDSIAIVKEDGLLRAYYLNGEEYDVAIRELDDYFILNSTMIKTSILLEVTKNRKEIKLFGLANKAIIYPNKKERRKIEDVILKTFWKKKDTF